MNRLIYWIKIKTVSSIRNLTSPITRITVQWKETSQGYKIFPFNPMYHMFYQKFLCNCYYLLLCEHFIVFGVTVFVPSPCTRRTSLCDLSHTMNTTVELWLQSIIRVFPNLPFPFIRKLFICYLWSSCIKLELLKQNILFRKTAF